MNISITFRQMETTDAVKAYANDKVARLQKFLRSPLKAQVTVSCQHKDHSVEVDISSGGEHFHAHETSANMYATIDLVVDKLERQIRNTKTRAKGSERASDHLIADLAEED